MEIRPFGRFAAVTALLLSIAPARAARADAPPTDAQLNAAREIFLAAEKDEDAQRWSDALDKLTRVAAVKLTSGVRYHTALCEEHLGRLLAALHDYKAAANQAHAENAADVLRLVDKRLADATDRLPRLVVVLVPALPDATLSVDGVPILSGTSVAVDPGSHRVEAQASGRIPAETTVSVLERDSTSIEVRLDPLPAPAPAAPTPQSMPAQEGGAIATRAEVPRDRTLALVATAGTLVLAAGGVGAYVMASTEHSDAISSCAQVVSPRTDACDSQRNTVRAWDWVAIGAWTGAIAAGALATVSFIRLHHDAETSARLVVGPGSIGFRETF
jgi:hypothetical protein